LGRPDQGLERGTIAAGGGQRQPRRLVHEAEGN
jgi:hypothetical protein